MFDVSLDLALDLLNGLAESRVVCRSRALRPRELAFRFVDGNVVNTGFTATHQAFIVELPVLVSISAEPLAVFVSVFVLEANRDSVGGECPKLFGQPVFQFVVPLVGKELANGVAAGYKLAAIAPLAVDGIGQRYSLRVA